jgi:hypothetical protein
MICCCSLAGTAACMRCSNRAMYVETPQPMWRYNSVGWICPRCGKVNAPSERACACGPTADATTTVGG